MSQMHPHSHLYAGNIENCCGNQQIELWQMYRPHCIYTTHSLMYVRDERSFVFFFLLLLLFSRHLLLLLDRNINKHFWSVILSFISYIFFYLLKYSAFAVIVAVAVEAADFYASIENERKLNKFNNEWVYDAINSIVASVISTKEEFLETCLIYDNDGV